MTRNPNNPPDPDDEKRGIDDDEGGSLQPFGAEDVLSDIPSGPEEPSGASTPGLENNGHPQFDVPGTLFVDPPDLSDD